MDILDEKTWDYLKSTEKYKPKEDKSTIIINKAMKICE